MHAHATASVVRLWALRGETSLRVECWISQMAIDVWDLTITYGSETVMHETYPDRASAIARAGSVKQQLVPKGWTPSS